MTQLSGFWTTDDASPEGHQVASYTQIHAAKAWAILAACSGYDGVAPNYLNNLSCTSPANETVRVNTGGAVVDGQWYLNDAAVDINIPSAVGAGNTRIDRIVAKCTWADFEVVLARIPGTDAATPAAPSLTQTPGTEYDIPLYQALVDTDGVITLTNERQFAKVSVDDSTLEWPGNSNSLRVKDDGITNAKLRNSAALSVIGRASNSTGDPADIVAGSDNYVLRRSGTSIAFGQVATEGIADGAVTAAKIANRTRVLFVPALPTYGTDFSSEMGSYVTGVSLGDAQTCRGFGNFYVPADFVSDMEVFAIVVPEASGNCFCSASAAYGAIGQAANTHTASSASSAVAVTGNARNAIKALTLSSAALGDIVHVEFTRTAGNALDTINNEVALLGWGVTYTADS